MDTQWNTRKFGKGISDSLCHILQEISTEDQILVVQPKVLALLNELLTFSTLTETTPVRKIIVLNEQAEEDIKTILESVHDMVLVFLIDMRTDLALSETLHRLIVEFRIQNLNIVFTTWENQISNNLLHYNQQHTLNLTHFIKSQVQDVDDINLYGWPMLPIPQIDDNLLLCNVLFNSEGENMYNPSNFSLQSATRSILLDNMVACVQGLIKETKTIVTHVVGFGDLSKKFLDLLHQRIENKTTENEAFIKGVLYGEKYSGLETDLIVIERDIDPLTPLLTQLTYAGLLDDIYQITDGGKLKNVDNVTLQYRTDEIWDHLKFMNFGAVGPSLNQSARKLQDSYDARHKAESVGEIRQFVDSLSSLQEQQKVLKMHTTLSSDILGDVANNEDYNFNRIIEIEQDILLNNLTGKDSLNSIMDLEYEGQVNLNQILRLVCILSLCQGGLKEKDFELVKRELIDSFGIDVCFQLQRLTLGGLFTNKSLNSENSLPLSWKKEYRSISTWLDTLPPVEDDQNIQKDISINDVTNPKDATFAYCGVVPLITRFIQLLYDRTVLSKNYSSQQPFMMSREPSLSKTGGIFEQIFGRETVVTQESWLPPIRKNKKRVHAGKKDKGDANDIAIIVFMGGVTLGEVSTIRYLQDKLREKGIKKRFVIVSDGLTNGARMIDSSQNPNFRN